AHNDTTDPVLYGNLPPREISMKDVFRSGDSSKKFKIAEGQWYRYAPSYVSPAYHLLEGFRSEERRVGKEGRSGWSQRDEIENAEDDGRVGCGGHRVSAAYDTRVGRV